RFNNVEEYDPATDTWRTMARLLTARQYLGGAALSGKLYALGGADPFGQSDKVEEGQVGMPPGVTYTFTLTGSAGIVCTPTNVNNEGYVVAEGGCVTYSGVTNQTSFMLMSPVPMFTADKTQSPASPVIGQSVTYRIQVQNTGTATITSLTVVDTVPFPVTGIVAERPTGMGMPVVADVPGTGTRYVWTLGGGGPLSWNTRAGMLLPREQPAGAGINGKLYVAGGSNGGVRNELEEYDPATNIWTSRAPMFTARQSPGAAEAGGLLYVLGGYDGGNAVSTNERYDPGTNGWTSLIGMPGPRAFGAAASLGGKVYVAGGYDAAFTTQASLFEYDPGTGFWTPRNPMPAPRDGLVLAAANGRLYAIGGNWGGIQNTVFEWNPGTDTWATKTAMPTGRYLAGGAVLGGRIYVFGGQDSVTGITADARSYDPVADTWQVEAPLSQARQTIAGAAAGGRIYAVAGFAPGFGTVGTLDEGVVPAGTLPPGATFTFTITGTVGAVCSPVSVDNRGWIAASAGCAPIETTTNTTGFFLTPPVAGMNVVKTQAPAAPAIGETVTYVIRVENTGTATFDALTVVDTVSAVLANVTTEQPSA
ncbi:MAG: kelch repeat-containing protein, partial [bacterium]